MTVSIEQQLRSNIALLRRCNRKQYELVRVLEYVLGLAEAATRDLGSQDRRITEFRSALGLLPLAALRLHRSGGDQGLHLSLTRQAGGSAS
ncbi:MAG TPA: hypothetical protein VNA87_06310 [Actinomycetota bacterium]|nr:hypothetical protein [Actinomycetota bacterium]